MQEKWSCDIKYLQVIEKDTMVFTPPQAKCNNNTITLNYISLCMSLCALLRYIQGTPHYVILHSGHSLP